MLRALPLLAAAATFAAAPAVAQADDLTLDVMAHGTITFHSGMDTGTASEVIDASVDVEHQIDDLWFQEGAKTVSSRFMYPRFFATRIGSDYTMTTPDRVLRWTCSAVGEAAGAPGEVTITREDGDLRLDVGIQETLEGNAACAGDNSTGASYRFLNGPLKTTVRVPLSALSDGSEVVPVRNLIGTCNQGFTCQVVFNGSINLTREGEPVVETPAGQTPAPTPTPTPTPAPGKTPTKPGAPAKPKVKAKRTKGGAQVTVTCAGGCGGRISALSVARKKQLAAKSFSAPGTAPKVVVLRFPKHTRGGVIVNVRATPRGGAPTTQRVKLR